MSALAAKLIARTVTRILILVGISMAKVLCIHLQLTDVVLAAEGRTIRGHKVVLSACSSYFENLFLEFDEKNQIVILKDTPYDDVSAIVEFMYKGEINVAQVMVGAELFLKGHFRPLFLFFHLF